MLTEFGLVRIEDLVAGGSHTADAANTIGVKVNPQLSRAITILSESRYWFIQPYLTEEVVIIGSPRINDANLRQSFVMTSLTNAWSSILDLDLLSTVTWKGQLIFGSRTGVVGQAFYNYTDGAKSDGTGGGELVTGSVQPSFTDLGTPNKNKRVLRVKIYGLSDGRPNLVAKVVPEYDLNMNLNVSSPLSSGGAAWDAALWDAAVWSQLSMGTYHRWIGVSAFGKKLALQLAIRGIGQTVITDYEILYEDGIGL
jgi:hypothetical protein